MATLLPPPSKRQRTAIADKAREQQELDRIPDDLGSLRVQFFDQATGQQTGIPVTVKVVDASIKNLELLLNTLQGNVCAPSVYLSTAREMLTTLQGSFRAHTIPIYLQS